MCLQGRNHVVIFARLNGEKIKRSKESFKWIFNKKHVLKPPVSNFYATSYKIIQQTELLENKRDNRPP